MQSRFKKVVLTLAALVSLGSASVSACTCPHRDKVTTELHSCHGHLEMPAMDGDGMGSDEATSRVDPDSHCSCVDTVSRTFAKSERTSIEHRGAVLAPVVNVPIAHAVVALAGPRIDFERPFYLTDSFYNLSPKRGPPVL